MGAADYGLMKNILTKLKSSLEDLSKEDEQPIQVYLTLPPGAKHPCVYMEIEEVWSNLKVLCGGVCARIKFKVTCLSKDKSQLTIHALSHLVQNLLDGFQASLGEDKKSIVRLNGLVSDHQITAEQRSVHQYYEAIVRQEG
ncbi:MAG TPA: hypothetical protein VI959_00230 [Alphaproteobacteria bacterium]|nr:hypothetical protein [Alphaproteobacteria bacterium]